jgi:hypothetical protein
MTIAQTTEEGKMKFVKAAGGTYSLAGDKYSEKSEFEEEVKTDFTLRVDADKLLLSGVRTDGKGAKYRYEEVYQREKEQTRKVASRIR